MKKDKEFNKSKKEFDELTLKLKNIIKSDSKLSDTDRNKRLGKIEQVNRIVNIAFRIIHNIPSKTT